MIDIKAPASKSCAQRAVLCATLAHGRSEVCTVGSSDDLLSAIEACRALGALIENVGDDLHITGPAKLRAGRIEVGESGLLTRLIAPVATLADGPSQIIGRATLNSRSMRSLLTALAQIGVDTSHCSDYLPLTINGSTHANSEIHIDGSDSSQVLSGLLFALPLIDHDTFISVDSLHSQPYIDLTINILSHFGIEIENDNYTTFKIRGSQQYRPTRYTVEGDWSGASYFLVADTVAGGGKIAVRGLDHHSTQADRAISDVLSCAAGLRSFTFDATNCPDLFPTLVALASHCSGQSHIIGTSRLTNKESARDQVLRDEWQKFGVSIDINTANTMSVQGLGRQPITQSAPIDPHGDHRIAMAAAIMGRGAMVDDKDVVNKSFPQFWTQYQRIEHLLNEISK